MDAVLTAPKVNIETRLARGYLFLMLLGLPLVFWNGFFDITEVKTGYFALLSVIYLMGRLVCFIQFYEREDRPRLPRRAGEIACLALCVLVLLSSAASGRFWESLEGSRGRWQGAAMFWVYAALYFSFRGTSIREKDVLIPLGAGLLLSGLAAAANHLGWDVLGLESELIPFDRGRYISTLGNINFAGAYISLALPIILWYFVNAESRGDGALWAAVAAVGLCAAVAVRSESTLLGLGAALAAMPLLLRRRERALPRFGLLLAGTAVLTQMYGRLAQWRGVVLSSLTRILLHPAVFALLFLIGSGWYILLMKKPSLIRGFVRFYAIIVGCAMALLALALVLFNTVLASAELGALGRWLHFSDAWGTDRVMVWKYCLGLFGEFPLWEKLLGGGCGVLALLDVQRRIFPDAVLDAAHCEYLQILLNWGLLGLAAYLTWLIAGAREAVKNGSSLSLALFAGLFGYAVQAGVNIAQAPGICLFSILFAVQHGVSGGKSAPITEKTGEMYANFH